MKVNCCILVFFHLLFSWEKGGKCLPLLCKLWKRLELKFSKIWKLVFLHNSNRMTANETEPFSCITSTFKEQRYTRKERTSSHLVQIPAPNLKIFMIIAAIIILLQSALYKCASIEWYCLYLCPTVLKFYCNISGLLLYIYMISLL